MQLLDRSYFRREKLRAGEGGRSEKVENQMKSET